MVTASRVPFTLLIVLVAGNILFIALHWLHIHVGLLSSQLWSIQRDVPRDARTAATRELFASAT